ncbi:MAG: type I methionyl aminopeptidase [Planctomycetaceae bacterium]|nr:type I methionyl aminopeptidase [Planctomycetaceae bacterium]
MQVKNAYDRLGLLAIGEIVASVLNDLAAFAQPGMTTAELDELAGSLLHAQGAEATPRKEYGFPGRLCISVNDEVVHGVPGDRVLREGDLVKLDLTADKRGYVADATRMLLLDPPDETARRLADTARRACEAAIARAVPGMLLTDLGRIIQDVAGRDGFRVVKELCGHGVGRRTHEAPEVPNYADHSNLGVLREGMVIAIEPILSAGNGLVHRLDDGWTFATADGALAGHYEEMVIIGADGAEISTARRL